MNALKYFLVVENGCQWQSAIIAAKDNDKTKSPHYAYDYINEQHYDLDLNIGGKFCYNICGRELHFGNKFFANIGFCYGWTISKYEFDTLKRMIELKPFVDEYNRLMNS